MVPPGFSCPPRAAAEVPFVLGATDVDFVLKSAEVAKIAAEILNIFETFGQNL